MSDSLEGAVVMCRSAAEPLTSSAYVLGYNCKACGKPLQVSPQGVVQIARGGKPLCNPCGMEFARLVMQRGESQNMTLVMNPGAVDCLKRKGLDPETFFERSEDQQRPPAASIECPLCGRPHTAYEGDEVSCQCGILFKLAKAGA